MIFEITREVLIRSLHSLGNPALSDAENDRIYGMCVRQHGHDYRIRVTLRGPLDERGQVFPRDRLEKIMRVSVVEPFDGHDLNALFPNTAGEALARAIFLRLKPLFPDGLLVRVGVQETPKNYFEFPPAGIVS